MTLLVRNEEDILEDNICYHLNNGVDFIVATDNGSTDKTAEILKKYQKQGALHYILEPDFTYEQDKWVSRMADLAVNQFGATHLFHCDADEFWTAKRGSLKRKLPKPNEIFQVNRINYIPDKEHRGWDSYQYSVIRNKQEKLSEIGKEKAVKRYLLLELSPKIITTKQQTQIAMGNHDAKTTNTISRKPIDFVYIRHFPIRSYKNFEKKVREGGSSTMNGPYANDPNIIWHWKAWYKLYQVGKLDKTYREIIFQNKTDELLRKKIVKKDKVPKSIKNAKKLYELNFKP